MSKVVVVPLTVRFPAIITVVPPAPIVRELAPTPSKTVLFPDVRSKSVKACKAVIVPPNAVGVSPIVIVEFANLEFAIEPANLS